MAGEDIIVTGNRVARMAAPAPVTVTAKVENLSDLKLYRIPVPVTVASKSQKQVAFLADRRISGALIYRSRVVCCAPDDPELLYRFKNVKRAGLGEALPVGRVILYQDSAHGRQLVGESTMIDKTVDLVFGNAQGVTIETEDTDIEDNDGQRYKVTVRNANPFAVRYELEFANNPNHVLRSQSGKLVTKPGKRVWATTLAPNSETSFRYDVTEVEDEGAQN